MRLPPRLFRFETPLREVELFSPSFETPLGRIDLFVGINSVSLVPQAAFTAGERSLFIWPPEVGAEILLTRPPLWLPPGMEVDGIVAAVVRTTADLPSAPLAVRCIWSSSRLWSRGAPETGENLDAVTWDDGHTRVTVGLPDYGPDTTYREDGFDVTLCPSGQIHFVCAWSSKGADDISTWFAVDCTPSWVLGKGVS
jgi:hypothetical protein